METNPTGNHEVAGLIPGLTHCVEDPVLLRAVVWLVDTDQIWCGCGCGLGWWQQIRLDPWESPCAVGAAREKTKKKKKASGVVTEAAQAAALAQVQCLAWDLGEKALHTLPSRAGKACLNCQLSVKRAGVTLR